MSSSYYSSSSFCFRHSHFHSYWHCYHSIITASTGTTTTPSLPLLVLLALLPIHHYHSYWQYHLYLSMSSYYSSSFSASGDAQRCSSLQSFGGVRGMRTRNKEREKKPVIQRSRTWSVVTLALLSSCGRIGRRNLSSKDHTQACSVAETIL